MFLTYLRRELRNRRKQTAVVAIGLALAIALVMVVSSVSAGVRDAQADVLESVYGVGTDITVTQTAEPGEGGGFGPGRFDFDAGDGEATEDGTREIAQEQLRTSPGTTAFDTSALDTVSDLDDVTGAAATLELSSTSFSGEMPDFGQLGEGGEPGAAPGQGGTGAEGDGQGGPSSFEIDQQTVTGIDPAAAAVGPLTTTEVADGRTFEASDTGRDVAVLDAVYAEQEEIEVGDTVTVGGSDLEVIGTVASTTGEGVETAANLYLPIDVAASLADLDGQVTTLYVRVDSSSNVDAVSEAIAGALPDATVSTQADLADGVSGSLSTASSLVSTLGTWLSAIVLIAAFGLAILFTVSGVNRRTRELGTLKALGWSQRRVVGQIAGESVAQGLIGGLAGVALGGLAVLAVNLSGITLSGSTGAEVAFGGSGGPQRGQALRDGAGEVAGGGPAVFGGGDGGGLAGTVSDVVLQAPVSLWIVAAAVGLAVLGGLVAGVVGGQRAARLRPAEAFRSLA
ncbi:ABC transporter permease [Myceligenerans xiligouense]|uniref:ABC-type lipoprotein release transport system permease subunit n=1 Tax=Myceligenerans xiligouense TaxID=253184 RepID=A0A3N4YFQ1_9MICO|nr:ABC transporter permease [Myceligenerans xiligouense]RPF19979.1 ABC-type lipoprotein release transport system permease subunit [Myceligenerans xiligouense]